MKKKKKGDKLTTVILIFILLAGLSLLLYPTFSEQWNAMHQSQIIVSYDQQVDQQGKEENERLLAAARDYNARLMARANGFAPLSDYRSQLVLSEGGAMAYLEIPSISCTLAVYHGTEESVLSHAVGHIEWTSLPVGGEGSHSVLSGHRGLPSAELLTNIDKLEIGDTFYIHVLGETLTYVVDDISVVLPEDTSKLQIYEGKDYVTLLTCTPYGINSHRLLVRGMRLETADEKETQQLYLPNEVKEISKIYIIPVVMLLMVAAAWAVSFVGKTAKKLQKSKGAVTDDETENEENRE